MKYPTLIPVCSLCFSTLLSAQEASNLPDYELPGIEIEGIGISGGDLFPGSRILDRTLLESWSMDELGDLADYIPSISFEDTNSSGYGNQLRFRGTVNTPYFSDPSVAVYVDGVPVGKAYSMPILLPMIEDSSLRSRAESLKTGRNSQGAVLYLNTPNASNAPATSLGFTINDVGDYSADVWYSTALSEKLSLGIQLHGEEEEGWVYNPTLDEKLGSQDSRFAQATLSGIIDQDTNTSWNLRLAWTDRDQDGIAMVPIGLYDEVSRNGMGGLESEYAKASFNIQGQFSDQLTWSSTSAWQSWELDPYTTWLEMATGPDSIMEMASELNQDETYWTEDIHLDYSAGAFQWNNGLFLSRSESGGYVARSMSGLFVFEENAFTWTEDTINLYSNLAYDFGDGLTVRGGLKWENVSKDLTRNEMVPAPALQELHKSFTQLLPFAEIEYAANEDWDVFATLSETYRPGGFSTFTGNMALMPFGKETLDQIEAGIRWHRKDVGFAQLNLFYQDIDGYQVERSFTETEYMVVNADQVTSQGLEFIAGSKFASSLNWEAAISWNDTEFDSYTDPFTGMVYSGQRPPAVPEYDGHISLWWEDEGPWSAGVDWTFQGKRFFSEDNIDMLAIDSNEELGAFIRYANDDWSLTLAARNLLDDEYYQSLIPGMYHAIPAAPCRVTLKFTWRQ